jgi:ABC-type nitrate/sulfonate/bicarbonate transport system ATPase subunit
MLVFHHRACLRGAGICWRPFFVAYRPSASLCSGHTNPESWNVRPMAMLHLDGTGDASDTHATPTTSPTAVGESSLLAMHDVTMRFQSGKGDLLVLDDVNLRLDAGEFVALVGPSGCGKSTLLSIIAGLQKPTSGKISLHGDPSARRLGRIGYMPQRDLLLPWRTALDNAIASLEVRGTPRAEARQRAHALFAAFGLSGFERSYPSQLSGGMRQRVAFARTALAEGNLLLLDEPFGALDALTRAGLQRWLMEIWGSLGKTCLLVTHDVDEALLLADRIYVMTPRPGRMRLERAVPLPRPRLQEILAQPEALALKAELLAALMEGA